MSISKPKNKDYSLITSITKDHLDFIDSQFKRLNMSNSEYLRYLVINDLDKTK